MAYKGRRVKKKPLHKRPGFWAVMVTLVLFLVLAVWTIGMLASGEFSVRTPDPTEAPVSMERPPEQTEETLPPPEANPYGPVDFMVEEDTEEVVFLSGNAVKGIDVSMWQGDVDWQQVRDSGVEFVMIRVGGRGTEAGSLYADDLCQTYYEGAKAAGLQVGAYFFSQSITVEEAVEEAEYTLEQIRNWEVDMPIVYDWEYIGDGARTDTMNARLLTDMVKAFCDTVREAGYDPMVYFGRSHSTDLLILSELVDYKFWLAMYNPIMDYPYKIEMWQYTETGSVPGISGNVDINLYFPWEED